MLCCHLSLPLFAVNEVSLENMSNDEAVGVLRDAVQKPAPIKLVVAKCWDPSPRGWDNRFNGFVFFFVSDVHFLADSYDLLPSSRDPAGYFTVPRQEPVRPIDPSAWVAHTEAVRLQQTSDYGSVGPLPPGTVPLTSNVNGGSMMGVPLGVGPASVGGMPISRLGHGKRVTPLSDAGS